MGVGPLLVGGYIYRMKAAGVRGSKGFAYSGSLPEWLAGGENPTPTCVALSNQPPVWTGPPPPVLHTSKNETKVELNTIASSFGCMSALTASMHRHLLSRFGSESSSAGKAVRDHAASIGIDTADAAAAAAAAATTTTGGADGLGQLIPDNPTLTALPGALAAAHRCYGKPGAVVLFVVQPGETNAVDQRLLEMKLWDDHGVRVVRMSLAEVREGGRGPLPCCPSWERVGRLCRVRRRGGVVI